MNEKNNNEQWKLLVYLLDEIRKEKGITHAAISETTGYHTSNITRFFGAKYTPGLDLFLNIAKAIGVNFFFEDKESKTDLSLSFEKAMERLGRRPDKLSRN